MMRDSKDREIHLLLDLVGDRITLARRQVNDVFYTLMDLDRHEANRLVAQLDKAIVKIAQHRARMKEQGS